MAYFALKIAKLEREQRGPIKISGQRYGYSTAKFSRPLFKQLKKQFAAFSPKLDRESYFTQGCLFQQVTPAMTRELDQTLRGKRMVFLYSLEEKYTDADYAGAKYVWLGIDSECIDCNEDYEPLNEYKPVLCSRCGRRDWSRVPKPLYISEANVSRQQDLYRAENGILIVSRRLKDVLEIVLGRSVKWGEVVVKEARPKKLTGPYFWMRPQITVGTEMGYRAKKTCPKCGGPTAVERDGTVTDFWDSRGLRPAKLFETCGRLVEGFPAKDADIALPELFHPAIDQGRFLPHPDLVVSGRLHRLLRNLKLKEVCKPTHVVHSVETAKARVVEANRTPAGQPAKQISVPRGRPAFDEIDPAKLRKATRAFVPQDLGTALAKAQPARVKQLDRALVLLKQRAKKLKGATDAAIRAANQELPFPIPPAWQRVLKIVNRAAIPVPREDIDITELNVFGAEEMRDCLEQGREWIKPGWPELPDYYLPVACNAFNDGIWLDTSRVSPEGECLVNLISHEESRVVREWPTVADFLDDVFTAPSR